MIKKLKIRFIVLAMTSLAVLLALIVAGMNIVNYEKVVSDADQRIEVLRQNSDKLLTRPGAAGPGSGDTLPQEQPETSGTAGSANAADNSGSTSSSDVSGGTDSAKTSDATGGTDSAKTSDATSGTDSAKTSDVSGGTDSAKSSDASNGIKTMNAAAASDEDDDSYDTDDTDGSYDTDDADDTDYADYADDEDYDSDYEDDSFADSVNNDRGLIGDRKDEDDFFFGRGGAGGPSMSRDEAEESRFFTVTVSGTGTIEKTNITRISAINEEEAEEYAEQVIESGKKKGFIEDFRFAVSEDENENTTTITFLDCGRVLGSFRNFLEYSIIMSVAGLLIMLVIITYFSGRIVKPVADSYEKQKRFITDAGHEIKTPLAIIKANIDLMNMQLDGSLSMDGSDPRVDGLPADEVSDLKESLGDINDQVGRLTSLTNDLVYLSRMEEDGSSLVMTDVPLSDIVNETVSSFRPLAAEKGKTISAEIAPMIAVKGSNKELEKLLSIVLENAIKYSALPPESAETSGTAELPDMPEIHVKLSKEGRNAVLEVSNYSESEMTNDSLSHVFDRFYRTDSSRNSQTGGHGIGLSMAKAIVTAHSGKITARTTDGHDFIITASIPAIPMIHHEPAIDE